MKPNLSRLIDWYSLDEIARDWDCTVENLHYLISVGALNMTPQVVNGELREGVSASERKRIETENRPEDSGEPQPSPQKLNSMRYLTGCMLLAWYGEDWSILDQHYSARDDLFSGLASLGLKPLRTRETDAELIRECLEYVKTSGRYTKKQDPRRADAIAEAEAIVQQQRDAKTRHDTLREDMSKRAA